MRLDPLEGTYLFPMRFFGPIVALIFLLFASSSGSTDLDPERMPQLLSLSGLFLDVRAKQPAEGFIPYTINTPFWSDGASKERHILLPDGNSLAWMDSGFTYPEGTVFLKSFHVDTLPGDSSTRWYLETRVLLRHDSAWHGFTYQWNRTQTDAELSSAAGGQIAYRRAPSPESPVEDGSWVLPSRQDCRKCHIPGAREILGFLPPQLNLELPGGEHQFAALKAAGILGQGSPEAGAFHHAFSSLTDATKPISHRARSWLASNCSQCHSPEGGAAGATPSSVAFDFGFLDPASPPGYFDLKPHSTASGDTLRVLAPGSPGRSLILRRAGQRGMGQMPPLASLEPDTVALALLREWIASLPSAISPGPASRAGVGQTRRYDVKGRYHPVYPKNPFPLFPASR